MFSQNHIQKTKEKHVESTAFVTVLLVNYGISNTIVLEIP